MSKKRVAELGTLPIIPQVFNNVQTKRNQTKTSVPESHQIVFFLISSGDCLMAYLPPVKFDWRTRLVDCTRLILKLAGNGTHQGCLCLCV